MALPRPLSFKDGDEGVLHGLLEIAGGGDLAVEERNAGMDERRQLAGLEDDEVGVDGRQHGGVGLRREREDDGAIVDGVADVGKEAGVGKALQRGGRRRRCRAGRQA